MSFNVGADAYGRFMGRYSEPLAHEFVRLIDPAAGQSALDVGCGPGALTAALVARLGSPAVTAVDPSESFVVATQARLPDVDVRQARAEALPFPDGTFDLVLAQLVIHFMTDPGAGLAEMARVARRGGVVSACVWDYAGRRGPLTAFWDAVIDLDPDAHDESNLAGVREGHLVELFERAGLREVRPATLTVRVAFDNVVEWWQPFTLGVGPAGAYVGALEPDRRLELESRCVQLLPRVPFEIEATAWTAVGRA